MRTDRSFIEATTSAVIHRMITPAAGAITTITDDDHQIDAVHDGCVQISKVVLLSPESCDRFRQDCHLSAFEFDPSIVNDDLSCADGLSPSLSL